jgi:choline dehydrogenase-like flavoprotein
MTRQFDPSDDRVVVVVGSGAGGGTLSNELAQKGIDVVCLEAGGRLTFADIVNDPPLMNRRMGWHDERRGIGVWLCKTVGGTTMRWSGNCPRFLAHEFRARTTYGDMDDATLIDWPITLEELEPYYEKAAFHHPPRIAISRCSRQVHVASAIRTSPARTWPSIRFPTTDGRRAYRSAFATTAAPLAPNGRPCTRRFPGRSKQVISSFVPTSWRSESVTTSAAW